MIVTAWWKILSIFTLFDYARTPLIRASAISSDAIPKELIEGSNHNINLQKLSPNITLPSTSSSTHHETSLWQNYIGKLFRVVCSWLSDVWNFYWWPSTKIIGTPHVVIELFQDTGKTSIVNATNNVLLSPPSPPKDHLRSTKPTGQQLGLQEEGHSVKVEPQARTKKPTSQPTIAPSGQPSTSPTRYDRVYLPLPPSLPPSLYCYDPNFLHPFPSHRSLNQLIYVVKATDDAPHGTTFEATHQTTNGTAFEATDTTTNVTTFGATNLSAFEATDTTTNEVWSYLFPTYSRFPLVLILPCYESRPISQQWFLPYVSQSHTFFSPPFDPSFL